VICTAIRTVRPRLWRGTLLLIAVAAFADDSPERLRARIATEGDLVHKAKLEMKLADFVLEQTRKLYGAGNVDKAEDSLKEMMMLCEGAFEHLFATHRDPRKRPGGFKETEIRMREFVRRLEDVKPTLPLDDRPPVEKAVTRLRDMHEDLLLGIMRVKKKEGQ